MKFRFLPSFKKRLSVFKKNKILKSIRISEKRKVKPVVIYAAVVLAIILPTIYIVNNRPKESAAAWYDENWSYRQRIPLTNAGSAQTDYQVSFTIDTAALITAGKMQSDCDDIRMLNEDGMVLPYWIEENNPGCNQTTTKIWVKVPSIPTTGSNIYIYYGNSTSAGSSDGNLVFPMFDDFADNTINEWLQDGIRGDADNDIVVSGGKIKGGTGSDWNGFRRVYPQVTLGSFSLDVRYNVVSDTNFNHIQTFLMAGDDTTSRDGYDFYELEAQNQYNVSRYDDNVATALISADPITVATGWHTFALRRNDSNSIAFYQDSTSEGSATDSTYTTFGIVSFNIYNTNNEIDYFFLRKYATTEPAVGTLASEEKAPGPLGYWKFDEGSGTTVYSSGNDNGSSGSLGAGNSAPQWETADECISGSCIAFDGSNDYIDTNEDYSWAQTDSFSFSFWINAKAAQNSTIFGKGLTGSTWEYSMRVTSANTPSFVYWNTSGGGAVSLSGAETITLNKWHHFMITYDGSAATAVMYMDGKATATQTGVTGTFQNRASNLRIGSAYYNSGVAGYFPGLIDEVKVYNYARSAAEAKADFIKGAANKGSNAVLGSEDQEYLSESLVGFWKMDENTGTTTSDSSGNAYTGTLGVGSSAPAWSSVGKFGSTLDFDGTNDYISLGTPTNLALNATEFTLSSWIYLDGTGSSQMILAGQGDANDKDYRFWVNSANVIEFDYEVGNAGEQDSYSTTTLSSGSWYHIVVVYKNDANFTVQIYVNGQLDSTTTHTYGVGSQNQTKVIGQYTNANYFNGKIDELRVYRKVFSPSEVNQLYEWAAPPVVHYTLDDNTGTSVADRSVNGNGATFVGSPSWVPGKYGSAVSTNNSTSDYVNPASDIDLTSQWTITSWFSYPLATAGGSWHTLVRGNTADHQIIVRRSDMLLGMYDNATAGAFRSSGFDFDTLSSGWHHLAAVGTGGVQNFYIDGVYVGQSDTQSTTDITAVGNYQSGSQNWGTFDDFKVYNYVRNQKQIVEDMNAGHPSVGSPVGSPVLNLRFDEGYGTTVYDASPSVLNGTLGAGSSAPSWSNDGKFGKTLNFDGTDDYVSVPHDTAINLTTFSISTWFKWESVHPSDLYRTIAAKSSNSGNGNLDNFLIFVADGTGKLGARVGDGSSNVSINSSGPAVNDSNWHHVVLTYDTASDIMALYQDGILGVSSSTSGATPITNTDMVTIGGWDIGASMYGEWDGSIDEFKIYSYALNADEIKVDYNMGKSANLGSISTTSSGVADNSAAREYCIPGDASTCDPPVAEWKLDENTGTSTVNDTSGNGYTGTISGSMTAGDWVPGIYGSALDFDGSDDQITTASDVGITGTTNLTISTWVQLPDTSESGSFVKYGSEASGNNDGFGIGVGATTFESDGNDLILLYEGVRWIDTNTPIGLGWHHVAMVVDGSSVPYAYLDGVLINSFSGTAPLSIDAGDPVKIGGYTSSTPTSRHGSYILDNVRIYDYARSSAQMAWEYNKGAPSFYYKLDECEGTTAYNSAPSYDGSSAGSDGTISIGGTGTETAVGTCSTSGAWSTAADGRYGSGLSFDGTDDSVNMTAGLTSISTARGTFSIWFRSTSAQVGMMMYGSSVSTGDGFGSQNEMHLHYYDTGQIGFHGEGGTTDTALGSSNTYNDGEWHQAVATWDSSSTSSLYVDGQLVATGATSVASFSFSSRFYLGRAPTGVRFFQGDLDEAKVYSYPLTAAQVKADYNAGSVRFE